MPDLNKMTLNRFFVVAVAATLILRCEVLPTISKKLNSLELEDLSSVYKTHHHHHRDRWPEVKDVGWKRAIKRSTNVHSTRRGRTIHEPTIRTITTTSTPCNTRTKTITTPTTVLKSQINASDLYNEPLLNLPPNPAFYNHLNDNDVDIFMGVCDNLLKPKLDIKIIKRNNATVIQAMDEYRNTNRDKTYYMFPHSQPISLKCIICMNQVLDEQNISIRHEETSSNINMMSPEEYSERVSHNTYVHQYFNIDTGHTFDCKVIHLAIPRGIRSNEGVEYRCSAVNLLGSFHMSFQMNAISNTRSNINKALSAGGVGESRQCKVHNQETIGEREVVVWTKMIPKRDHHLVNVAVVPKKNKDWEMINRIMDMDQYSIIPIFEGLEVLPVHHRLLVRDMGDFTGKGQIMCIRYIPFPNVHRDQFESSRVQVVIWDVDNFPSYPVSVMHDSSHESLFNVPMNPSDLPPWQRHPIDSKIGTCRHSSFDPKPISDGAIIYVLVVSLFLLALLTMEILASLWSGNRHYSC